MKTDSTQYLSFELSDQVYAFPVLSVLEINQLCEITPIPQTADYVLGVINLRGKIIPVIDMRLKLKVPKHELTKQSCIIVLETDKGPLGSLVDRVDEVLHITADHIDTTVAEKASNGLKFLTGMARVANKLVMLIDIDSLNLNHEDLEEIQSASLEQAS